MEREVTMLVFMAIALVILLFLLGRLVHRMCFDFEARRLKVAERNTMRQLSKERTEIAEKMEAESERQ